MILVGFEIPQKSSCHDLNAVVLLDAFQDDLFVVDRIRSCRLGVILVPPLEYWQKDFEQVCYLLFSDRLEINVFEEKNKIIEQNGWGKRVESSQHANTISTSQKISPRRYNNRCTPQAVACKVPDLKESL